MDIVTPTALQAATAALFATRGLPTATRNAVLEDDDLQDEVISIINTATANGSGMGDGITTLAKTYGFTITSDEVYAHQDFLGQDGDLTDFELELISGGQRSSRPC